MEFRNIRDRPPEGTAEAGRPPGDRAAGATPDRLVEVAQPEGKGPADRSARELPGAVGAVSAAAAGRDAPRLDRWADRVRSAQVPDRSAQDSTVHRPEGLTTRPALPPDRQKWLERLERAENRSGVRDELKERLNRLEHGHPSSPWHEDGTPRPPAPKLSDLEEPLPRLSDADYKAHVGKVVDGLENARAAGLTTEVLHSFGPDHQEWNIERTRLHKSILDEKWASATGVPCEGRAVIAGGLGGAGKTTVLEKFAQIDRAEYLTINPDEFKKDLAERGSLPEIPGLSPMEASSLAHEESSYLAKQLALRAYAERRNIIWDITMSSSESATRRVDELQDAGYSKIDGVFVDIPVEVSVARSEERHRRGCDLYRAGQGIGGRFVPPTVIRAQADTEFGSVNRQAFEALKNRFDEWSVYDNSVDHRDPVLVEAKH
jgi:predicted ABC-type ATPase